MTRGPHEVVPPTEDVVERFETAWLAGARPRVEDFLAADPAALVGLIHADLDYRLAAGQAARVEDYLRRFPSLADDRAQLIGLLAHEFSLRRGGEPDLTVAEYQRRFPELGPPLADALRRQRALYDALRREAAAPASPTEPILPGAARESAGPATTPYQVEGEPEPRPPSIPGFDIVDVLGRGGMGVVYRARQHDLKRTVALKMILAGAHADRAARSRFRNEAQAIARLQHPNIVQVFAVGEHDGLPYFALEYCPGGSLARQLGGTPLPPADAAGLAETLARAMHAAHQKGIVHRDLKPGNVLLAENGTPKISDFRLARIADDDGRTATGAVLGTPSYMAPEQATGRVHEVGPATDVYALGAILYECLTGRPPFKAASTLDTALQVARGEPVPPRRLNPYVPVDLETVCLKCLETDPARRYRGAEALADDLGRFRRGEPVLARPASPGQRVVKWVRRRPVWATLIAVCLLGVFALAGLSLRLWQSVADRDAALLAAHDAAAAARASEAHARALLYAADLRVASRLWQTGDVGTARALLERHRDSDPGFAWRYFTRQLRDAEARALPCPGGDVRAVAVSADGLDLATGSQDGTIRLWDVRGRQVRATWQAHAGAVTVLQFLTGRPALASGGADGTVRVWDRTTAAAQGPPFTPYAKARAAPHVLAVSRDGRLVAAAVPGRSDGSEIEVWDRSSGKRRWSVAYGFACRALAFSPDATRLVAGEGPVAHLLDAATGQTDGSWHHASDAVSVAFSDHGWLLAIGRADGDASVIDLRRRDLTSIYPWSGETRFSAGRSPFRTLAFAPDCETLALAGDDGIVRQWSLRDGAVVRQFRGHADRVLGLAFTPDGRTLVSAGADGTARLWDTADVQPYTPLTALPPAAGPLACSPGTPLVAAALADRSVALLDVETGQVRAVCRGHGGALRAVALAPDGRTLATVGLDLALRLWDPADGRERATRSLPDIPIAVAISTEGLVAVALQSGPVRCWDTTGAEKPPFAGAPRAVRSLAFAADGKTLVSTGDEPFARSWDVATRQGRPLPWKAQGTLGPLALAPDGRRLAAVELPQGRLYLATLEEGAQPAVLSAGSADTAAIGFSPDGRLLAVPGGRATHLIDTRAGAVRDVIDHPDLATAAVFHRDGQHLVTATASPVGGALHFWDVRGWLVRGPAGRLPGPVSVVHFSPAGDRLYVGTRARRIVVNSNGKLLGKAVRFDTLVPHPDELRVWDVAAGREIGPMPGGQLGLGIAAQALTPDGATLLIGSEGGTVWRWDVAAGRALPLRFVDDETQSYWQTFELGKSIWRLSMPRYTRRVCALAVAPDGATFATATDDGTVRLWDTAAGEVRRTLAHRHQDVACLAFHPKGGTLAVNDGGQVRLWDAASGGLRAVLAPGHREPIRCLAFAPDGGTLLTGGLDRRLFLWDPVHPEKPPRVRAGHTDAVSSVAITPDSRLAASGSWDGTIRLWQLATAQELATLEGGDGKVECLAFAPDGRTLASGGSDRLGRGAVRLWRTAQP